MGSCEIWICKISSQITTFHDTLMILDEIFTNSFFQAKTWTCLDFFCFWMIFFRTIFFRKKQNWPWLFHVPGWYFSVPWHDIFKFKMSTWFDIFLMFRRVTHVTFYVSTSLKSSVLETCHLHVFGNMTSLP